MFWQLRCYGIWVVFAWWNKYLNVKAVSSHVASESMNICAMDATDINWDNIMVSVKKPIREAAEHYVFCRFTWSRWLTNMAAKWKRQLIFVFGDKMSNIICLFVLGCCLLFDRQYVATDWDNRLGRFYKQRLSEIRAWISNYSNFNESDVIIHPWPNFSGGLDKPPLKKGLDK